MPITVGEVRTSPDLKVATVHVCPLGGRDPEAALKALNDNRSGLRRAVSRGLTLKHSPELRFRLDDTYDKIEETRRMLSRDDVRRDLEN